MAQVGIPIPEGTVVNVGTAASLSAGTTYSVQVTSLTNAVVFLWERLSSADAPTAEEIIANGTGETNLGKFRDKVFTDIALYATAVSGDGRISLNEVD